MEEQPSCEVKNVGHLGLIASLFKEYSIVEKIDALLPKKSNNQFVTHGEVILAMVLQGLGFSSNRFYLSSEFFSHVALQGLFRPAVKAQHFNADTLGRTLDEIYKYGPTRFFTDSCLKILLENRLLKKYFFIDTTTFCATGKKYKNVGNVELKYGYSKDYRMDLKQLVYLLVTTEEGLPVFAETHSGNESDNNLFQDAMVKVQNLVKEEIYKKVFVLDSALYSKDFLLNKFIKGHWITRVPESVKLCKDALERDYDDILWTKMDKDYKYLEFESFYSGVKQRWLLIRNREAKYKEIKTLDKQLIKEGKTIEKGLEKLQKKIFFSKEEAQKDMGSQKKYHPNFIFTYKVEGFYKHKKGHKRKIRIGYIVKASFIRDNARIQKCKLRKGKFIVATNCLDSYELASKDVISAYRSRNGNVEGCFKFLKDKTHNLNQIFLKKETRIEALIMVMSIILFINNLGQKKLRDYLAQKNESVPNQLGKNIKNPTFKWVSYLMRHITKVQIKVFSKVYDQIKGVAKVHETIIKAFGDYAMKIYGIT